MTSSYLLFFWQGANKLIDDSAGEENIIQQTNYLGGGVSGTRLDFSVFLFCFGA